MIRRVVIGALLAVAAAAAPAHAQIVNVQGLIVADDEPGVAGAVEAALDWRTGNVDLLLVRGIGTLRYLRGDHLVFALVRGDYGRSGEPRATFVAKIFEHVRYRYRATSRVTAEAFVQHEADQFRRLRVRALAGVGPRLQLHEEARWALHVGVAYMLEYEQLLDDGQPDAGEQRLHHRLSSYLVGRVAINDKVTGSETVYLQPRLDRPSDLRLLSESALAITLSARVTFRNAFVIAHDAAPPAATERTDTSLQTSVAVSF